MKFSKYFCRLVTTTELEDAEVEAYYDVVEEFLDTKIVTAHSEGETFDAEVLVFTGQNNTFIYEVVLDESVDLDEGEQISDALAEVFDFDFEFETSLEI